MSYQVLARKWRPAKFAELVGQDHVKAALINGLTNQRLHHAYLFTGTRGVGKTTIARIFAKSLNCETGISAEPCGQCGTCLDVDAGRFVDLIEIDAASRTKVGDTREILDNVQYAPTRGRYKVYLIDEVHMLSRHSFNALLKTLEEPPEHVKFLLATTDPQKLPVTILSRCLQFNLQALSIKQISEQLNRILIAEQLPFEQEALLLLAKYAKGSMRDGLSLTDQAIAQSGQNVTLDIVQQMMGTVDISWSQNILAAILNNDADGLVNEFSRLTKQNPDIEKVLDDLLSVCHQIALTQIMPNAAQLNHNISEFIKTVSPQIAPQVIQVYYQILLQGKRDLKISSDAYASFEMICLRLLAFKPVTDFSGVEFQGNADASLKKNSEIDLPSEKKVIERSILTNAIPPTISESKTKNKQEVSDLSGTALNINELNIKELSSNELKPNDLNNNILADNHSANSISNSLSSHLNPIVQNKPVNQGLSANHEVQAETHVGIDNNVVDSAIEVVTEAIIEASTESITEDELIAQQNFYNDMAQSQGFDPDAAHQMSPGLHSESYNDVHEKPSPANIDEASVETTTANTTTANTTTANTSASIEFDSPVMAILAARGFDSNLNQQEATPRIKSKQESAIPDPIETKRSNKVNLDASIKPEDEVFEPEAELMPLEHEEVRYAHEVDSWASLIERSNLAGRARQLALNASVDVTETRIEMLVKQEFMHLLNEKTEAELNDLVLNLAPQCKFVINRSASVEAAPAEIQKDINQNRQQRAEQSINSDAMVTTLLNEFDGKIIAGSIRPL